MNPAAVSAPLRRIFLFFIPMGISAVLINLSHVIINGTLARSHDPQTVLAGYALAMSLLVVSERPAVLLRQTCSALVRDRLSYRAVRTVGLFVCGVSLIFGSLIAYTSLGHWLFGGVYGAAPSVAKEAVGAWHALMFLTLFSGLRCVFQGVIIYRMRTRWLTIGMIFRLSGMFLLSRFFLHVGVTSALQGAVIFVAGMMIEALLSWLESRKLVREMPEKQPENELVRPKQVMPFYKPLLSSSLIVVWVFPILNALLGTTDNAVLAVASLGVAGSLMNLTLGFFTYFHQIALHFGKTDPAGSWLLKHLLGVRGELLEASLHALQGYLPFVLVFPWLDTLNGFVMSHGATRLMFGSQTANAVVTTLSVLVLTLTLPHWAGALGSLAQSIGVAAELMLLAWLYRRSRHSDKNMGLPRQAEVGI
jgi:hypothetical protein